jgi:hypothetical protein
MISELREEYHSTYGQRIEEVNPTPGNKAGGITTLVEKSMGNIKKMGTSPVQGVLKLGEPVPHPGLWIIDNRAQGPDPFNLTGLAMEGAVVTAFSSGRGSPVGNAVMPTLKLTGNPETFEKLASITDFNAGTVIQGCSIPEPGAALYAFLLEVANGRETKSESRQLRVHHSRETQGERTAGVPFRLNGQADVSSPSRRKTACPRANGRSSFPSHARSSASNAPSGKHPNKETCARKSSVSCTDVVLYNMFPEKNSAAHENGMSFRLPRLCRECHRNNHHV